MWWKGRAKGGGDGCKSEEIFKHFILNSYHLSGQVVRHPPREANLGSNPAFAMDLCPGPIIPVTPKLVIQWLPCLALAL